MLKCNESMPLTRNVSVFPTRAFLEVPLHKKFQIFTSAFQFGIEAKIKILAFPLGRKSDFPKSFSNNLGLRETF